MPTAKKATFEIIVSFKGTRRTFTIAHDHTLKDVIGLATNRLEYQAKLKMCAKILSKNMLITNDQERITDHLDGLDGALIEVFEVEDDEESHVEDTPTIDGVAKVSGAMPNIAKKKYIFISYAWANSMMYIKSQATGRNLLELEKKVGEFDPRELAELLKKQFPGLEVWIDVESLNSGTDELEQSIGKALDEYCEKTKANNPENLRKIVASVNTALNKSQPNLFLKQAPTEGPSRRVLDSPEKEPQDPFAKVRKGDMLEAMFQISPKFADPECFFVSGFHWELVTVVDVLGPVMVERISPEDICDTESRTLSIEKTQVQTYKFLVNRQAFYAPKNIWTSSPTDIITNTAENWLLQDEETVEITSLDCRFCEMSGRISNLTLRPHDSVEVQVFSYDNRTYWWMPGTAAVSYAMSRGSIAVRYGYAPRTAQGDEDFARHLLFDKERGVYIPGAEPPARPVHLGNVKYLPMGCERLFERMRGTFSDEDILSPTLARSYLRSLSFTKEELDCPIYISVPENKTYLYLIKQLNSLGFTILNKVNGYSSSTGYQMVFGSCMAILCFKESYKSDEKCMDFFRLLYNLRIPVIPLKMKDEQQWDNSAMACFGMAPQLNFIDLPKFGRWPFNIHLLLLQMKKILSGVTHKKGPMLGSCPPPAALGDLSVVLTSRVPPSIDPTVAETGSVVEVCMPVKIGTRWEPSFPIRLLDKQRAVFVSYAWKTSKLAQNDRVKSENISGTADLSGCGVVDPREIHKWLKFSERIPSFQDWEITQGSSNQEQKSSIRSNNHELFQRVILSSKVMIACLSSHFLQSTSCMSELTLAIEQKIPIIFVLVGKPNNIGGDLKDLKEKIAKDQWPSEFDESNVTEGNRAANVQSSSGWYIVNGRTRPMQDVKNHIRDILKIIGIAYAGVVGDSTETDSVTSSRKTDGTYINNIYDCDAVEKEAPPKDPFDEDKENRKNITFWAWIPVILSQRSEDGGLCKVIGMGTMSEKLLDWTVETVPDGDRDVWVRTQAIRPFQDPSPDLSGIQEGDRVEVRVYRDEIYIWMEAVITGIDKTKKLHRYSVLFDRIDRPSKIELITVARVSARQIRRLTADETKTSLAQRFQAGVLKTKEFKLGKDLLMWRKANSRMDVASFPTIEQISQVALADQRGDVYDAWSLEKGNNGYGDKVMISMNNLKGKSRDLEFKIEIVHISPKSRVAIGMAPKPYPHMVMIGQERFSFAYQSDNHVYWESPPTDVSDNYAGCPLTLRQRFPIKDENNIDEENHENAVPWEAGDIIGCKYSPSTRKVSFEHIKPGMAPVIQEVLTIANRCFHISISCMGVASIRLLKN
ncbi:hypothetical protein HDU67_000596 [Dinochytrium kinnereticum]|nr:hypothetical protein HDU67_000596 [Dinochytrium kinnereticum]